MILPCNGRCQDSVCISKEGINWESTKISLRSDGNVLYIYAFGDYIVEIKCKIFLY